MFRKWMTAMVPTASLAVGIVTGDLLHTRNDVSAGVTPTDTSTVASLANAASPPNTQSEPPVWFSFSSSFIIPLIKYGDQKGKIVIALSLETSEAQLASLAAQEPRLRDAILRQLLIRANDGLFDGNFTSEAVLSDLRQELLTTVRTAGGQQIQSVDLEGIDRILF
jgi:flagellar FliL protein